MKKVEEYNSQGNIPKIYYLQFFSCLFHFSTLCKNISTDLYAMLLKYQATLKIGYFFPSQAFFFAKERRANNWGISKIIMHIGKQTRQTRRWGKKGINFFFVCTFNFPSGANLCLCIDVIFQIFTVSKIYYVYINKLNFCNDLRLQKS